ncbi:MAG: FapA family protein [Spirochaetaceae bacterium]|nr:FapA family protein [Spirochaetaceae bacterium]
MVDFAGLQGVIKERLSADRAVTVIEAEGLNLEDALAHAAQLLNIPIRKLEYEVLSRKSSFLGVGESICKIRVCETIRSKRERKQEIEADDLDDENIELIEDMDGGIFIQRRPDGAYLKVTPPTGEGAPANENQAEHSIRRYSIEKHNQKVVTNAVLNPTSEYVRIADYQRLPEHDTVVNVEITEEDTKAYITVLSPGKGGVDLTYEQYCEVLTQHGVVKGINEDFLKNFADRPIYHRRICIATGKNPIDGMDAYFEYYFETDVTRKRIKETGDGKIDFKELNTIQNVLKGESLAKKVPAQDGVNGYSVTGKLLPAQKGKDTFSVPLGKNVSFAADGLTIVSDINGQVMMTNDKINIELVHVVDGSVNLKSGNVVFLGNVVVTGNVEEGFYVKAAGNIEVQGSVEKAALSADGDIFVKKGITGKKGVKVLAKKSISAKFAENADLEARESVMITDSILNSNISAGQDIVSNGKRASIIGGRLRAGELISAKTLGGKQGSTETLCEVGYDPIAKTRLENYMHQKDALNAEFNDVQLNLQTLLGIKEQRKSLPEDKEKYLHELEKKRAELDGERENINKEIEKLENTMESLSLNGRVCASVKVYQGVVVFIRDKKFTVRNELDPTTFILNDGRVTVVQNFDDDKKRRR